MPTTTKKGEKHEKTIEMAVGYHNPSKHNVFTALPCRISIYEEGGKTMLDTLKPTTLLAMFNAPQLERVTQEAEDTIVKIRKEAAAWLEQVMKTPECSQNADRREIATA